MLGLVGVGALGFETVATTGEVFEFDDEALITLLEFWVTTPFVELLAALEVVIVGENCGASSSPPFAATANAPTTTSGNATAVIFRKPLLLFFTSGFSSPSVI